MSDKHWKAVERWVADKIGGKRIPITGRGKMDIEHEWLSPEVKDRKELPGWFTDAVEQARINADGKLAVVFLVPRPKPGHKKTAYVVMDLDDFIEHFNPKGSA